jgi:hypothetical protein
MQTQYIPGITMFTPNSQLRHPQTPGGLGGINSTGFAPLDSAQQIIVDNPLPVLALVAFLLFRAAR